MYVCVCLHVCFTIPIRTCGETPNSVSEKPRGGLHYLYFDKYDFICIRPNHQQVLFWVVDDTQ
jgi:hypothetical protein